MEHEPGFLASQAPSTGLSSILPHTNAEQQAEPDPLGQLGTKVKEGHHPTTGTACKIGNKCRTEVLPPQRGEGREGGLMPNNSNHAP